MGVSISNRLPIVILLFVQMHGGNTKHIKHKDEKVSLVMVPRDVCFLPGSAV